MLLVLPESPSLQQNMWSFGSKPSAMCHTTVMALEEASNPTLEDQTLQSSPQLCFWPCEELPGTNLRRQGIQGFSPGQWALLLEMSGQGVGSEAELLLHGRHEV